jgi:tRNA (mo5U34)-methyltransferase
MTLEEIKFRAESFGLFYHEIELCPGYKTQSCMADNNAAFWQMIRSVRERIDYQGKSVLDLGTFDGMWAFEAEKLGASHVVACDIWQADPPTPVPLDRFLFARQVLNSRVWPVTNGDVQALSSRLRDVLPVVGIKGFDIVQNLGLMYHVENPLLALREIRKVMNPGGIMLLETACWTDACNGQPAMRWNNFEVYGDHCTYWVPNLACLKMMLNHCGFVNDAEVEVRDQLPNPLPQRVCLITRKEKV